MLTLSPSLSCVSVLSCVQLWWKDRRLTAHQNHCIDFHLVTQLFLKVFSEEARSKVALHSMFFFPRTGEKSKINVVFAVDFLQRERKMKALSKKLQHM